MTITSRCNHPGPLAKLIPTVSVTSLLARLLRCPDCGGARPFPGEDSLVGTSLPRRMAGDPIPNGVAALIAWMVVSGLRQKRDSKDGTGDAKSA